MLIKSFCCIMGKVKTNFDFKTSWTFFFLVLKYSQSFIIQTCFPLLLFLLTEDKICFIIYKRVFFFFSK